MVNNYKRIKLFNNSQNKAQKKLFNDGESFNFNISIFFKIFNFFFNRKLLLNKNLQNNVLLFYIIHNRIIKINILK